MSAPEFPRRVSVAEVVHNARCELYEAVQETIYAHPWLERWAATFDFSFVVDRDVNASADTTYLVPVQYGTFTLGIKANLKQGATGTYVINFSLPDGLGKFAQQNCSQIRSVAVTPRRLLNGEIGLRRWLGEVIPEMEAAWIATSYTGEPEIYKARREYAGKATKLSYTIEFGVTVDGSLLPSWALAYPNRHQFKPAFSVFASDIVTHKLIVGLTPIAPAIPPPPIDLTGIRAMVDGKQAIIGRRVCVTNSDRSSSCFIDDPRLRKLLDDASEKIGLADEKKKLGLEKREQAIDDYKAVQLEEGGPLKDVPLGGLLRFSEPRIKQLEGLRDPEKVIEIRRNYMQAEKEIEEAASERDKAIAQRKRIEQEQERARAKEFEAAAREAQEQAWARARAESEAETERRLQQIVQEQIIRDAFRQQ